MISKKNKIGSSKLKIDSENEIESNPKQKVIFDGDSAQQIEQLNKNQILMKAAQNFFKEKTGDEQQPVKDSIRIFNNFRIRSSSPQQQQQQQQEQQNSSQGLNNNATSHLGLTAAQMKQNDKNRESINLTLQKGNNSNQNMTIKFDMITENSTAQVQQNNQQSNDLQLSQPLSASQSPTKQLQIYKDMRDEANLRMTKNQMKHKDGSPERNNKVKEQKNRSEWILQQISKFSPQLVLKLEDPIIIQAINNLDLTIDEMKQWIQVSDFYSIQESTRMQMRRYLTALNETFYKIESIVQERQRIIQQKIKDRNDKSAMNKQEKFFQSYVNSRYYREFDAMKSIARNPLNWKSEDNKYDMVNSLSINVIEEQQDAPNINFNLADDYNSILENGNGSNDKKEERVNKLIDLGNKQLNASLQPKKQSLKYQPIIQWIEETQPIGLKINKNGNQSPRKQSQLNLTNNQQENQLGEKIEEEGISSSAKEDATTMALNEQSTNSLQQAKELSRTKFTKQDLQKKLQQKIHIEERLTNLQINEALKYEEDQANLQVALKKKKLLSHQRKQKELHEKLEKVKQRNNYVEERKNNYDQWKQEDQNRRFQAIKQIQQEQIEQANIKEKQEQLKNLQSYEREQKTQLKFQINKEQEKLNYQELSKQRQEGHFRIEDSIEVKNTKHNNNLQNRCERIKSENEQKAQIVYKQFKQQKKLEEQIAAEVAKKYDQSSEFKNELQKQRQQKIKEINREYDRKQKENQERIQMILQQEEQIKTANAKLLSNKIASSEKSRMERIENLKKQISQSNMNKVNKTMQSFCQTKEHFLEKGNQYLKDEYNNRDNYQDDVNTYQQYLKKCSAIRIHKSFEREVLISSPKKIKNSVFQNTIRSNQFKNTDHSF